MAGSGSFDYSSGGCRGPEYANRAQEGSAFASGSYRYESGISGVVEGSAAVAQTKSSRLVSTPDGDAPPVDEDELGRVRTAVTVAPRVGYHHDYFGLEGGPFLYGGDDTRRGPDEVEEVIVLPSAMLWGGVPEVAFVRLDFLSGSTSSLGNLPVSASVGHASERVRGSLGLGIENSLTLDGSYRVHPNHGSWVGLQFVQRLDQHGTFGSLSYAHTW